MKTMKLGTYLVGLILIGLGVASALTNPDKAAYDEYATDKLTQYVQERECTKASESVQELCKLLDQKTVQDQLQKLISTNTDRQNFWFFSLYKTDLAPKELLPSFLSQFISLPSYHFETVGLFNNFQTYKADRLADGAPTE